VATVYFPRHSDLKSVKCGDLRKCGLDVRNLMVYDSHFIYLIFRRINSFFTIIWIKHREI